MDELALTPWLLAMVIGGGLLFAASLAVWTAVFGRIKARQPIVPYVPRRPVPWDGAAVLAAVVIFLGAQVIAVRVADVISPVANAGGNGAASDLADLTEATAHPVARLLESRRNEPFTLLLCALAALVVAPLAEELLFRLVLQGWLEAREQRWRRRWRLLLLVPRGVMPITLSALPFALLHARGEDVEFDPDEFAVALLSMGVASLLAVVLIVALLRLRYHATAADLGFVPARLPLDVALGLGGLFAMLVPLLFMQGVLYYLVTKLHKEGMIATMFAPDPLPLFLLAVVLGYLYRQTHRLGSSVVLHMTFNGSMLAILLLSLHVATK